MKRSITWKNLAALFLLAVFISAFALTSGLAQRSNSDPAPRAGASLAEMDTTSDFIPIQGRLTEANGSVLNGDYNITLRLYEAAVGGTSLCEDTRLIGVEHGLFHTSMRADDCPIDGRQLYLGIQVESDPEMLPRLSLDNVPYAWTLRPGATIEYALDEHLLFVDNTGEGSAILGRNINPAGYGYGVTGISRNSIGVFGRGVYEESFGVLAASDNGVALRTQGTGIIQSTATSTIWISGNGVRPFHQADSTIIDMNTVGGAAIYRGAVPGNKNVMLPLTLPGQLYGQDVTLTDLDLYWVGSTAAEAISAILLRRQTGVCATSTCYETILHDSADHTCFVDANPTGCTEHYDLSANNILSTDSGILYLTIELDFSDSLPWIVIGGVRLTLAHE